MKLAVNSWQNGSFCSHTNGSWVPAEAEPNHCWGNPFLVCRCKSLFLQEQSLSLVVQAGRKEVFSGEGVTGFCLWASVTHLGMSSVVMWLPYRCFRSGIVPAKSEFEQGQTSPSFSIYDVKQSLFGMHLQISLLAVLQWEQGCTRQSDDPPDVQKSFVTVNRKYVAWVSTSCHKH